MGHEASGTRWVFVLGRSAVLDTEDVTARAAGQHAELVLLSLGYPVSPEQDAVVQSALREAADKEIWFDAVLVPSPTRVGEFIRAGDEVTVLASGSERRKLERALGTLTRNGNHTTRPSIGRGSERRRARTGRRARNRPHITDTLRVDPTTPGERSAPDGPSSLDATLGGLGVDDVGGSESVEALAGRQIPEPLLDTVWTREEAEIHKRGRLVIYLGAAPGVGKTFAMLQEGQRAGARGTDIVVGIVQTYGRPRTIEALEGLEVVPPRILSYRGSSFEEMDVEAVIARRPERVMIDELAHTNIPGSRRAKRWEDVLDVLAEGVTVISTLNAQHLASLNDVVAKVTGVRQQETVPDWLLDLADQVELVDMSPYALQRRMVHGNVYPDPQKAELALRRFFTIENLTALRELALMRVANQVDDELLRRWSRSGTPETRERILVCVSRRDTAEELIRRGARMAHRTRGDLLVAHATSGEDPDPEWLERNRRLVMELGGEFEILGTEDDPVESILSFAYQQHVTQIVVGESLRSRWRALLQGSFVDRLIRRASNIDVHVIARAER